jgi:hypothetical protein
MFGPLDTSKGPLASVPGRRQARLPIEQRRLSEVPTPPTARRMSAVFPRCGNTKK